jgi:hypothetical protein
VITPPAPGTVIRGQTTTIFATASDPEGGNVTLFWSTSMGDCAPAVAERDIPPAIATSPPGSSSFELAIPAGDPTSICVYVVAKDPEGATGSYALTVSSTNQPPVAKLTVLEPTTRFRSGKYELYSIFRLSAATSHDPDGDTIQTPKFDLYPFPEAFTFPPPENPLRPDSPSTGFVRCPNATPSELVTCLAVGAHPGRYTVTLTVGDGLATDTDSVDLDVEFDHPPCVGETDPLTITSPLVLDPAVAKTFTVTKIFDDGAPLPTPPSGASARPKFQWTVRRNGGTPNPVVGYEALSALTLPAGTYVSGDVVDVSVTISDGVAMHLQPLCDLRCPADCPQSANWTVTYR